MNIAFDVDGTLITFQDTPRYEIIQLFHTLSNLGNRMIIWSGGGVDYATRWAEKLGLKADIYDKGQYFVDIAFDDEDVKLGTINLKV